MKNSFLWILLLILSLVEGFGPLPPKVVGAQTRWAGHRNVVSPEVHRQRGRAWWKKRLRRRHDDDGAAALRRRSSLATVVARTARFALDAITTAIAWPIATLLARVINHPQVRRALGQCIVSGFKDICQDPDLDYYVDEALGTVNEDISQDAREAGETFPLLVREFLLGMIGSRTATTNEREEKSNNTNNSNNTNALASSLALQ